MKRYIRAAKEIKRLTRDERVRIFGNDPQGKIVIPEGYTDIGFGAFRRCTGITSVKLPNSIEGIDTTAFTDCTGLTSIIFGDNLIWIGESAFLRCSGLTSIDIPDSVKTIGRYAFSDCTNLKNVNLPETTKVMDYAFLYSPVQFSSNQEQHSQYSSKSSSVKIPSPYNKYFDIESDDSYTEDDYVPGDVIDGYDCHFLAFLMPKEEYDIDIYPVLTDDPEYPVCELAGGRLYPVDIQSLESDNEDY